jgi:4-amino-4-deoxychorismate lyase
MVYIHDTFLPAEEAKISLFNRGFLYGDGIFTTVRVSQGKPQFLESHLKKLRQQCDFIKLSCPRFDPEVIPEMIRLNHAQEGTWRLKILAVCAEDEAPRLLPVRRSMGILTMAPYEGGYAQPVRLGIYPFPVASSLAKVKSLAYLERLRIKDYAIAQGVEDALVFSSEKAPLETAFANIFWKDDHGLHFPHPTLPFYEGVIFEKVVQWAQEEGYPVHYELSENSLKGSQVYICNSMIGLCPVEEIGGQKVAPRDIAFEHLLGAKIRSH